MIKAIKTNNNRGGRKMRKRDIFIRFVEWIALTIKEREKIGVPTQQEFANKYKINTGTLSEWKKRSDFNKLKSEAQIEKLQDSTTDVLEGLKNRCIKYGMAYDVELFLLYVEKWDRKHVLEILGEIKLGDNDIRTIIGLLPENKQKVFYDTLVNLIAEAENTRVIDAA